MFFYACNKWAAGRWNGRFLTKLTISATIWFLIVYVIYRMRSLTLDVSGVVPHLNSRFLLQNRKMIGDPMLTRHLESTTETANNNNGAGTVLDLLPYVDRRPSLTEDELVDEIQRRMPNLPIVYWNRNKNKPMGFNSTCARFPNAFDLEYNNLYWQTLRTSNGTFQLYGAYLDNRAQNRLGSVVRILGMIDRIEPTVVTHCHLWFDGRKEPVVTRSFEYKYIWYKKWGNYKQGIYQPYLTACVVPKPYKHAVPQSVSLVERACDNATNNLRVIYERPDAAQRKDFAVCVKGLDFLHEDLSVRLIEWIELLNLLGADKIYFYELQVHPNISKVLDYYEREGKVHVTPISLPGGQPNAPAFQHLYLTKKTNHKRQNELIPYNDCFYKHMYEYRYVVLLDIDEVIVPVEATTWQELMDRVLGRSGNNSANKERESKFANIESKASYNVRNVYFLDDLLHDHGWFKEIPRYMHMLQHVYRTKNFTKPGQYVKCFHNTEKVLTLHNHFPLSCLGGGCASYAIEPAEAQLNHYRADCVKTLKKSCEEFRKTSVMDTAVWRFKEPMVERVTRTLTRLGYFNNVPGGGVVENTKKR